MPGERPMILLYTDILFIFYMNNFIRTRG